MRGRKLKSPVAAAHAPASAETLLAGFDPPYPPLPEAAPSAVLLRGATIWTSGEEGTPAEGDLLARGGKIVAVGRGLEAPRGALIIDGRGKHVTPGLIDCHSHSAMSGGVNESSASATAEVRIEDVIDAESIQIYRQLAGGVTAINLLHGSANAIGGQNAVVKLRSWGAASEAALRRRPAGDQVRARRERQAVELGRRVHDSLSPRPAWASRRGSATASSRRATTSARSPSGGARRTGCRRAAISSSKPWPRSSRASGSSTATAIGQDEILMLMRAGRGVRLPHRHLPARARGLQGGRRDGGARRGGSSFSDWWAYKFEVYRRDPVQRPPSWTTAGWWCRSTPTARSSPAGSTPRRRRRSSTAALPEAEALKLRDAQPGDAAQHRRPHRLARARQGRRLRDLGREARCRATRAAIGTWVDGRRYFDRERDLAARPAAEAERIALIAKARRSRSELESRDPKVDVAAWQPTFGVSFGMNDDAEGHGTEQGVCE